MAKLTQPKLEEIAPLLNSSVVMFIWLNFLIGWSILVQAPNPSLIVMGSYFLSYLWAGYFFFLAALLLYGKLTNNWGLLRVSLAIGLFGKIIITYALLLLAIHVGFYPIIGILSLWLAITWVQYHTVKYFKLPGEKYAK